MSLNIEVKCFLDSPHSVLLVVSHNQNKNVDVL